MPLKKSGSSEGSIQRALVFLELCCECFTKGAEKFPSPKIPLTKFQFGPMIFIVNYSQEFEYPRNVLNMLLQGRTPLI